ncbi:hypothetical protein [Bowmanella denitrificans]|uniref:hypothetical protein n=1 Tax=Bowmanella denitrificans TaxID=366582 RepID=UPI000C99B16D|nr:hypothetical protein [Bowmanella denitrificans]
MREQIPDTSQPRFVTDKVGTPLRPKGKPLYLLPLVLLCGLLIWLILNMPQWLPKAESPTLPPPQPVAAKLEDTPFQDAQLAKARREAQDILQQLLSVQQTLESQAVSRWAENAMQAALRQAEDGDNFYQQRQFTQALDQYQASLKALQTLQQQSEQVFVKAMTEGQQALMEDDPELALSAFDLAHAIHPEDKDAHAGLLRAQSLPQVLKLLKSSGYAEEDGKIDEAIDFASQAHGLDNQHLRASQTLARLQQSKLDQLHRRYMSEGLTALAAENAGEAINAFNQALKLKPKDADSLDALRQAKSKQLAQRIAGLMRQGQQLEAQERWTEAIENYQQADALQPNLVQVRVALLRATARAELDELLRARLAEPLALRDERQYASATALLEQASRINLPGPRLSDQISTLQHLLVQARDPVSVQLISDNQTEVQLFKVGGLGTFDSKQLHLYPGKYTLLGKREGYREVLHEFILNAGDQAPVIHIRCTEKIGSI